MEEVKKSLPATRWLVLIRIIMEVTHLKLCSSKRRNSLSTGEVYFWFGFEKPIY